MGAGQTLTGSAATDTPAVNLSVSCVPLSGTVSCSFALKVWFSARGPQQTVSQACCNQMQVYELYHHLVWLSKSATKLAGSNSKTPYSSLQPQGAMLPMPLRPSIWEFTAGLLKGFPEHASMLKRLGSRLNGMQACSCIVGHVLGGFKMWGCR